MFDKQDWNLVFGLIGGACALGGAAIVGALWWMLG